MADLGSVSTQGWGEDGTLCGGSWRGRGLGAPPATGHPSLPSAACKSGAEGTSEGLQGLYSSHDKQARHRVRVGTVIGANPALHATLGGAQGPW